MGLRNTIGAVEKANLMPASGSVSIHLRKAEVEGSKPKPET